MKQSKRLLSLLLSASIAAGMFPAVALADEADETQIITMDEAQIAEDVAAAAQSEDAIVLDDGADDPADSAEEPNSEEETVEGGSAEAVTVDVSEQEAENVRYVRMNVPYTDFYAAYNPTDAAIWQVEDGIDAVTTATTSKFLGTDSLANGTYNNGKYIMGVSIPVAVQTEDLELIQPDANTSYQYTELTEAPDVYSTLTVDESGGYHFSALQESTVTNEYLSVTNLDLNGGYGDYQIELTGLPTDKTIQTGANTFVPCTVYGALLNMDSGASYGMTSMENLWFGTRIPNAEIAWSIKGGQGLQRAHGSGGEYYQFDMNGGTLKSVTLITNLGVIEVNANLELPKYYTGDLSGLSMGLSVDSDKLSIQGVPAELEDVKISVSGDLAKDASIVSDEVQLTGTPVDGTNYTVTISSSNYPDITRTVSTKISDAQKAELQRWIDKANAIASPTNAADLAEHVKEAEEMIANPNASSYEAAVLIGELTDKVKVNYSTPKASATLKGSTLAVSLDVDLSKLENPTYTLTSGSGHKVITLTSGKLSALTLTLDAAPTAGTTYTLTIVSDNYQNVQTEVTAVKDEQTVTAGKDSYSKTYGDAAVNLGASAKTELSYASSDKTVATVDANGKVTAVGAGTATITVSAAETDQYAAASKKVTVTVAAASQTVTTGSTSYSKTYGDAAFTLGASAKTAMSYSSSNTAVAAVDSSGKVTLKGKGTATITVKAAETSQYKAASKTVTVTVAAASQTITTGSASYSKKYGNAAFSLGASTSGNGALTYSSNKTSVATVSSSGKVTIKGVGTATITIKAAETNQYNAASKTVKVTVAKGTQTISAKSYTKAYGAKAFSLGATAKGKLTYKSSNTKVATISSTGKVTIKGVGKATITINAAATTNYNKATAKKVTITVNPAATSISSLKNVSGKKMTVKWSKKSSAAGYQIQYSTSSSFKSVKKTTTTSSSKTISGLTKGKTYYVRVRGYKKVSGKTYYASWSTAKKVKITK